MVNEDNDTGRRPLWERVKVNHIYTKIYRAFPDCVPRYKGKQEKWEAEARQELWQNGPVNPFSEEEYQELLLDIAFWLRLSLYAHYWECEERNLSWEEFLSLTSDRARLASAAELAFCIFARVCRADLDVFEREESFRPMTSKYDYATRKDLAPADGHEPVPILPLELLKDDVDLVMCKLEAALFIKAKMKCRRLDWQSFRTALEVDPVLSDVLAQRIRWVFSTNMRRFREIWESSLVLIPPLHMLRKLAAG